MTKLEYGLLAIGIICLVPTTVYAVSYNGWDCNDGWATKATVCYLGQIYEQNKILIQEQNQTNHLLAMEFCKGGSSYQNFPTDKYYNGNQLGSNQDDYWKCVSKVLGDTK